MVALQARLCFFRMDAATDSESARFPFIRAFLISFRTIVSISVHTDLGSEPSTSKVSVASLIASTLPVAFAKGVWYNVFRAYNSRHNRESDYLNEMNEMIQCEGNNML